MNTDQPNPPDVSDRITQSLESGLGLPYDHLFKMGPGGPELAPHHSVAAALSGGGHRASLFALGVMMALRDAGKQPKQVSSVSGGSITNLMLADRYFRKAGNDPSTNDALWEQATRDVFDTIRKGVLTKPWLVGLVAFIVLPPVALILFAVRGGLSVPGMVLGLAVWLSLLLFRGLLIEQLMVRRYFSSRLGRPRLSDLVGSTTEQVVCCTDLVLGRPVYFSTRGRIFRRTADLVGGAIPRNLGELDQNAWLSALGVTGTDAGKLAAGLALRASAAFPGIPPRVIQWKKVGLWHQTSSTAARGFLSDGGVWNNLATEPFEDAFLWDLYGPFVIVVADASGELWPVQPTPFLFPGLSEIRALVREVIIQNTNTVGPRRRMQDNQVFRELRFPGGSRFTEERLYISIDCTDTPPTILQRFRDRVPEGDSTQVAYATIGTIPDQWIEQRVETQRRLKSIHEIEAYAALDTLARPPANPTTTRRANDPVASFPTTLGKVDKDIALGLVGRGYANTAVALYLCRLTPDLVAPHGWLARAASLEGSPSRV